MILGWTGELGSIGNPAFCTALLLVPVYILLACGQAVLQLFRGTTTSQVATLWFVAVAILGAMAAAGHADEPARLVTAEALGNLELAIVEPEKPVTVPDDAVIIPYDPDSDTGTLDARRIIVPYDKYVELWNLAYPDRKLADERRPANYSFSGSTWSAQLTADDFFQLTGRIDLEVYTSDLIAVPLGLDGGVLVQATLDGQPARIQFVEPVEGDQKLQAAAPDSRKLATLYVAGTGAKKLELVVRYPLARRGGWRVVQGRVPAVAASGLTLIVPEPETELRLAGIADRAIFETSQADEKIETAFRPDSTFRIEWRPKVARASIDRSLTVASDAVFDVQEDGLRLTWRMNLSFPLSERDFFTIELPKDFLLEQVTGDNLRGWEV
jgi:hypothetical protein